LYRCRACSTVFLCFGMDGQQWQWHLFQPAFLGGIFGSGLDSCGRGLFHHGHHHALHARPAGFTFPRSRQLGVSRAMPSTGLIWAPRSGSKTARKFTAREYGRPSIRHPEGTLSIFPNVNPYGTHVFRSANPAGPWAHNQLKDDALAISARSLTMMGKSASCMACETSDSANSTRLWLRAHCDLDSQKAIF
jgi:hypothetical protein